MVAAKLAKLKHGQRQTGKFAGVATQSEAAEKLNVSERSIRTAKAVQDRAEPEVVEAVERGDISVSEAAHVADEPPEQQRRIVKLTRAERRRRAEARKLAERDIEIAAGAPMTRLEETYAKIGIFDHVRGLCDPKVTAKRFAELLWFRTDHDEMRKSIPLARDYLNELEKEIEHDAQSKEEALQRSA
jgi:hypothetical protein